MGDQTDDGRSDADGTTPTPPCPACGSHDVVPILYGFPAADAFEAEKAGLIAIGGCEDQEEEHRCRACARDF